MNREQLRNANGIRGDVVAVIIDTLMENAQHWGDVCYQVR